MPPEPNTNDKELPENTESTPEPLFFNEIMETENTDSSDEGVETEYAGYKLLEQDDTEVIEEDGSFPEEENIPEQITNENLDIDYQNLVCSGLDDDLPSTGLGFPMLNETDDDDPVPILIEMNENQVQLVKNVMAGFTLPEINVPDWAKSLSEDQWIDSVETTIEKLKTS